MRLISSGVLLKPSPLGFCSTSALFAEFLSDTGMDRSILFDRLNQAQDHRSALSSIGRVCKEVVLYGHDKQLSIIRISFTESMWVNVE